MGEHYEVHDDDVVSRNEMKEKDLSVKQMEDGGNDEGGNDEGGSNEGGNDEGGNDEGGNYEGGNYEGGGSNTNNANNRGNTGPENKALLDGNDELKPRKEDPTEHTATFSSQRHNNNRVAFQSLQSIKKQKKIKRHQRNSQIKMTDLNYFKDEIKRNHNSHVHRVGNFANRAYYTYFSYHPSIRQSAWVFHNAHHGVHDGWRDYTT